MTEISGSKLAELTGKSWRTIQRRLSAARIEPVLTQGKAHLFDSVVALAAIFEVDRDTDVLDLSAERARLARLQADRLELDLQQRQRLPEQIAHSLE
jgi:phage terminase Nu1 subunit (DNA packaging protein)